MAAEGEDGVVVALTTGRPLGDVGVGDVNQRSFGGRVDRWLIHGTGHCGSALQAGILEWAEDGQNVVRTRSERSQNVV